MFKFPTYKNKEEFLYVLYNNYGYTDLKLCYNYNLKGDVTGELRWSKWFKYSKLLEYEPTEYIPEYHDNRTNIIKKVTHRNILDIEIVFDVDEIEIEQKLFFNNIKQKSLWIFKELKKEGFNPVMWWTGSKSYHIHVLVSKLRQYNSRSRQKYKQDLLRFYGCDLQKGINNCMIAMEGAKHYKSGKNKQLIK